MHPPRVLWAGLLVGCFNGLPEVAPRDVGSGLDTDPRVDVETPPDRVEVGGCPAGCAEGFACVDGACRPVHDAVDHAVALPRMTGEVTVEGSTTGATFDGPEGCGSGAPNVWYSVEVTGEEVLYADTAGSGFDTRLYLVGPGEDLVPGSCEDDAGCVTGGFTDRGQTRLAAVLAPGRHHLAVSGRGPTDSGRFTLHVQRLSATYGSYFYGARLEGSGATSTYLVGTSRRSSTCGGSASGEDVRWFLSCGERAQFFSLCASDGGAFTRQSGATRYDPVLYLYSARTGAVVACNDDGGSMGGTDCRGTGGDGLQYGPRLAGVAVGRGLHAVVVDEREGGSGLRYTLRYALRD